MIVRLKQLYNIIQSIYYNLRKSSKLRAGGVRHFEASTNIKEVRVRDIENTQIERMGYSSSKIGLCLFLFFSFALLSSARISLISFSGTSSSSLYFSVSSSVPRIYSFV